MNLFDYIQSMKNSDNMVIGIAGLAVLALFLLVIVLKMLGGMRRGVWRQLIRTGMTLAAAVVSYFIATGLSNSIIGSLNIDNIEDLIVNVDSYVPGAGEAITSIIAQIGKESLQEYLNFVEYVVLLPATLIIIPIIATVVFLVINLILKIVRAIITKIAGFKKAGNNAERLGGALLGAVEGIIWMIMVTLPLSAMLGLVNQVYEKATAAPERAAYTREIEEEEEESNAFVEIYEEFVAPFTKNPASMFIRQIGADAIADGIATVTVDGRSTNMRGEVLAVADVVVEATKLADADFTALKENEKESLTAIVFTLSESTFMSKVMVGTLNTIPTLVEQEIIPIDIGETPVGGLVDSVMVFLEKTSTETLEEDLTTLTDVYFGLCDSGIISAVTNGDDVMEAFKEGKDEILGAINSLSSNERTENIVDSMFNTVVDVALGTSSNTEDNRIQQIKDGISQIAGIEKGDKSDEDYISELSDAIINVAKDNLNIELEPDMTLEAAKFVNDNLSEEMEKLDAVTKDKIKFNELVFALLDAYDSFNNGEDIDIEQFEQILDIEISDKIDEFVPEE